MKTIGFNGHWSLVIGHLLVVTYYLYLLPEVVQLRLIN